MASLPPIRKLYLEDYATQKAWIGPLLLILNTFMSAVVSALTKGLTVVDNTTGDILYVTLNTVPSAKVPVPIAWNKSISPVAVMVGQVSYSATTPAPSGVVQVEWQMNTKNTAVEIINVSSITPTQANTYTLTLICIAG
jgi:hypothetical protein